MRWQDERSRTLSGQRASAVDILVQLVLNSKSTCPTVWSFTTNGDDSVYDKVTVHVDHEILDHLDVASIVDCAATFPLDPDVGEGEKPVTTSTP